MLEQRRVQPVLVADIFAAAKLPEGIGDRFVLGQRYGDPDRVTDEQYVLCAERFEEALEEALRAFLYDLGALEVGVRARQ